jgi:hypothetical protein
LCLSSTIAQRERMRTALMNWCRKGEQVQKVGKAHIATTATTTTTTTNSNEVKALRTEYLRNGNWYAVEDDSCTPEWAEAERQVPVGGRVRRANPRFA